MRPNAILSSQSQLSCRSSSFPRAPARSPFHPASSPVDCRLVCSSQHQPSDHVSANGDNNASSADWHTTVPSSLPSFQQDMDWRDVRARLVARSKAAAAASVHTADLENDRWAHEISKPETGCILLAHPLMFQDRQQYFHQSVILILDHSDEKGSWGIILNRPTVYKVKKIQALYQALPEFGECTLHMGGDVGESQMQLLHSHKLEGAREVVKGVYLGGVTAAKKSIRSGDLDAASFRWFVNYAGWKPRQLANECKMGVWFLAAASPALILELLEMGSHEQQQWHTVLDLMGGSYRTLSDRIKQQRNQTSKAGNVGDVDS